MTGPARQPPETAATPLHGDAAIVAASGLALPSLRVLQSAGAVRAEKHPKEHGGFRRMWPETDVLKAAIGAALGEHFSWNIRVVAAALARGSNTRLWDAAVLMSLAVAEKSEPMLPEHRLIAAERLDLFADLIDRRFLFLRVPPELVPLAGYPVPDILLGMVAKDDFQPMSSAVLSAKGRAMAREKFGEEKSARIVRAHKLAMATHGNFLSQATINIGMQVRAAWRRLHGLEAHFVQDIIQPR